VHARDIERSGLGSFLSEGDRVEFDISADRRTQRPLATNLSIV
jgi:cold shock CspA family protein